MNSENIYPIELEEKYNHIVIGTKKVATLLFVSFPITIEMFSVFNDLDFIGKSEVSLNIIKQDKTAILKRLTSIIASAKEEIITTHENRIDADVLKNNIELAKKMRHEIQVQNEDIYQIQIMITLWDSKIDLLKARQKEIINHLYAKQFVLKPTNFRQKEAYLATLPLQNTPIKLINSLKLVTSSSLALLFPYYTNNLFEKNGIIIGKANEKLCMYNIFANNHSNYNMTILGSSGSGKSYFVKLMILRNKYLGRKQIIFDPEGEYVNLVNEIGGNIIEPHYRNMLYIEEGFAKKNMEDFLDKKVSMVIQQICGIQTIEYEILETLKKIITRVYLNKNITGNLNEMYREEGRNTIYINKKYIEYNVFPTINNLISEINKDKNIKIEYKKILKQILTKFCCNERKTPYIEEDIILFNLKNCTQEDFKLYMNAFFDGIDEYKEKETIIYIDEIWKCVSFGSDEILTAKIFNMYKTLRKEKMGIISITQDVTDFFAYQNGLFGKSILNNSYSKVIFNLQYIDVKEISKITNQTEEGINKLKTLERGNAFMQVGNSNIELSVKASEWEHKLIEGRNLNEDNVSSSR